MCLRIRALQLSLASYFNSQRWTNEELFDTSEVLSRYNLYTVELLKFVIHAMHSKCPNKDLNSFFSEESEVHH